MAEQQAASTSGRDHYAAIYERELESEAQWLAMGAAAKADSIGLLLRQAGLKPKSILELGAGTGEVIKQCQQRGYGEQYVAVDFSDKAIEFLRKHSSGIDARVGDITSADFSVGGHFDLVILSHVLEHLEQPADFLNALRRIDFTHLIAEVPLEDLLLARLKSRIRDRTHNPAGHVQFFTRASFTRLLGDCGFKIDATRLYTPTPSRSDLRFMCNKNGWGRAKYFQVLITGRYLPLMTGPLWRRFYYANFAALCRKS